jgi:hypothetical protein
MKRREGFMFNGIRTSENRRFCILSPRSICPDLVAGFRAFVGHIVGG